MSSSSFRTVSVRSGHSYAYALAGVPGSLLGDLEGSLRWGGFSGVGGRLSKQAARRTGRPEFVGCFNLF